MAKNKRAYKGRWLRIEHLVRGGACSDAQQRFRDEFGKAVYITPDLIDGLAKREREFRDNWNDRGHWLACHTLSYAVREKAKLNHNAHATKRGWKPCTRACVRCSRGLPLMKAWAKAFVKYGKNVRPQELAW